MLTPALWNGGKSRSSTGELSWRGGNLELNCKARGERELPSDHYVSQELEVAMLEALRLATEG